MTQDLFSVVDSGSANAEPFVVVKMAGRPRGKAVLGSRWVPPNPAKGRRHGFIHHYVEPKTRAYMEALGKRAKIAMGNKPPIPAGHPIALRVYAMVPIPKSWSKKERDAALAGMRWPTVVPDHDNYVKNCGDAFNGIVWADDSQVCRCLTVKEYAENPGLIVEVYRLP